MFSKRLRLSFFVPLLLVALLAAACGSTTTGSSNSPTATSAPTTAPTAAATTPASSSPVVMTANATVGGKSVTILTNAQGMTLYYYKPDTPTTSACTGGCAQNWPPLTFSGSGTPTSSTPLPGKLSVVNTANGAQVEYQGHLLYTFIQDTAAGQTTGQGKGGVWFVATTDLAPLAGGTTPTPTTSNGYGYNY